MKCHFVNRTSWHCSWSFASSWSLLNNCWRSSWSCSLSFKAIWDHLGSFKVKLDDLRSYWKLSMPSLILDFELFQSSLDFFLTFWEVYGWPDRSMDLGIWPQIDLHWNSFWETTNGIQGLEMLQSIHAEQHLSRWRRSDKIFILIVLCNNSIFENLSSVSLKL